MPEHVRISQTIATFSPARFVAADRVLDRSASGPKWLEEAAIADLIAGTIQIGEHERHFDEQHEKRIYSLGARASVFGKMNPMILGTQEQRVRANHPLH